jgi:hypothetical protein
MPYQRRYPVARRRFRPATGPRKPAAPKRPDVRIEYPSRGATYCRERYGIYEYSAYPRHSVLAGQQCRRFVSDAATLEEAQAICQAEYGFVPRHESGCGYQAPYLGHLPDPDGPDPQGELLEHDE